MKNARTTLQMILIVVFLLLSALAPTYCVAGEGKSTLSKKELKVLLRTAKDLPEHRRIADYYRQQAERLTNSSKEHQEWARIYRKNAAPPAIGSKHDASFGPGSLCLRWAQLEAEEAKLAKALAMLHEEMAKAVEQK